MSDLAFLGYLKELHQSFPRLSWDDLLQEAGGPEGVTVLVVDLVRGFCDTGPLASPRINGLLEPTAQFLEEAHSRGISKVILGCDSHPADSPEFENFPPHCVTGTSEAEVAATLTELPFAASFQMLPKRSLSAWLGTDLENQLRGDDKLRRLVIVGDCSDLCVYQAAMTARLLVNHHHLPWQVLVVSSLVDTYDLPLEVAKQIGAVPHPGDLLHRIFLYHMHLNGVRVVSEIA